MIKKSLGLAVAVCSSVLCAISVPAVAGPITLETQLVFDTGDTIVAPRLGKDGIGDYVVFERRDVGPFGEGPGQIVVQRLDGSGAPDGALQFVPTGASGNTLADASGQWVVYLADLDGDGAADQVRLHDLGTGNDFLVSDDTAAGAISGARIAGDMIVWNAGDVTRALNVSSIGTGTHPTTVRGPVPATRAPEVDSRFIVWEERLSSDSRIGALEIGGSAFFAGEFGDGFDEIDPATWGDLIAFGLVDLSTGLGDIVLANILADATQTFDLDLEGLSSLALTGDFLTFNALDSDGVSQAFLLRLVDGALEQLTSGPEGAGVADVFGDLVTYTSGQQLFVAQIGEGEDMMAAPEPASLTLFGLGLAGLAGLGRRGAKRRASVAGPSPR